MRALALPLALAAAPAAASELSSTITDQLILPAFEELAADAAALADAAEKDCGPQSESLRAAYGEAFDAWIAASHYRFGPTETDSRAFALAFWPDSRGFTPKTLKRLIAGEEEIGRDPVAYGDVSIAARGLYALEYMLYDPEFSDYEKGSYACTLVQTMTRDLARQAASLDAGWEGQFADVLRTAGQEGNATYMAEDEAIRALYTQILTGLEFTADTRLGRPLGTFERPRPTRAASPATP